VLASGAFAALSLYSASARRRARAAATPTWHSVPDLPLEAQNQTVVGKAPPRPAPPRLAQRRNLKTCNPF